MLRYLKDVTLNDDGWLVLVLFKGAVSTE